MRIATALATVSLLTLTACGAFGASDDSSTPASPTPGSSTSPSPSAEPSATESPDVVNRVPEEAADLVGDWGAPEVEWMVHFRDDGTFVEDFQGVKDFRVGRYELTDGTVSLIGDDGNTDTGQVEGRTLVFPLGTLSRS